MKIMLCLFCQIANKETKSTFEYKGEKVVAFKDACPKADIHILIVPKKHIATFFEIKVEENLEIIKEMNLAAQNLISKFGVAKTGYKLVFYGGRYQHVPHLHWHFLADRH